MGSYKHVVKDIESSISSSAITERNILSQSYSLNVFVSFIVPINYLERSKFLAFFIFRCAGRFWKGFSSWNTSMACRSSNPLVILCSNINCLLRILVLSNLTKFDEQKKTLVIAEWRGWPKKLTSHLVLVIFSKKPWHVISTDTLYSQKVTTRQFQTRAKKQTRAHNRHVFPLFQHIKEPWWIRSKQ